MKCMTCNEVATHYVSVIFDLDGETEHADGYGCDFHTHQAEQDAERSDDVIEFKAEELPK